MSFLKVLLRYYLQIYCTHFDYHFEVLDLSLWIISITENFLLHSIFYIYFYNFLFLLTYSFYFSFVSPDFFLSKLKAVALKSLTDSNVSIEEYIHQTAQGDMGL